MRAGRWRGAAKCDKVRNLGLCGPWQPAKCGEQPRAAPAVAAHCGGRGQDPDASAGCAHPSAAHKCHGSSFDPRSGSSPEFWIVPHGKKSASTRRSGSASPRAARSVKLPETFTLGAEVPCSSISRRRSKGPDVASRTGGLSARSPAQRNNEARARELRSVRRADRIDAIGLTVGLQDGSARRHAPSVVTRLPASLTSHQPPVHTSTATASRPAELQRGGVVQGCEG
eukprot:scaffold36454_cov68-Phaeocystis_antarctica.AAC.1